MPVNFFVMTVCFGRSSTVFLWGDVAEHVLVGRAFPNVFFEFFSDCPPQNSGESLAASDTWGPTTFASTQSRQCESASQVFGLFPLLCIWNKQSRGGPLPHPWTCEIKTKQQWQLLISGILTS